MILAFRQAGDVDRVLPTVAEHLNANRILAYPTETVYGLGSAPTVPALHALAALKGRPRGKPFLLLIDGRPMAEEWGLAFPPAAEALAKAFWPGPLTLSCRGE
jgi:L-threonylcarbamoyladenylate synthase